MKTFIWRSRLARTSSLAPNAATGLLFLVFLLAAAGTAVAHAVVYPEEAPPGAYQKYVLRVPTERPVATTRVQIEFPEDVRVIAFDEVPGWELEAAQREDGTDYTRATWSGTLPPGRFVEFGFIGVNPREETVLQWNVVQTYEDGEAVAWTGPADSNTPASTTQVRSADADEVGAEPDTDDSDGGDPLAVGLGGVALLVALVSLGLVLRPDDES